MCLTRIKVTGTLKCRLKLKPRAPGMRGPAGKDRDSAAQIRPSHSDRAQGPSGVALGGRPGPTEFRGENRFAPFDYCGQGPPRPTHARKVRLTRPPRGTPPIRPTSMGEGLTLPHGSRPTPRKEECLRSQGGPHAQSGKWED